MSTELTPTDVIQRGDLIQNPFDGTLHLIGQQHFGKTVADFRHEVHVDFVVVRKNESNQ